MNKYERQTYRAAQQRYTRRNKKSDDDILADMVADAVDNMVDDIKQAARQYAAIQHLQLVSHGRDTSGWTRQQYFDSLYTVNDICNERYRNEILATASVIDISDIYEVSGYIKPELSEQDRMLLKIRFSAGVEHMTTRELAVLLVAYEHRRITKSCDILGIE